MARILRTEGFVGADPAVWQESIDVYVSRDEMPDLVYAGSDADTGMTFIGVIEDATYARLKSEGLVVEKRSYYPTYVAVIPFDQIKQHVKKTRTWR